ncbi:hypothetical protein SDC9_156090 [bioreactor metagenome]|uniref:Uncharacterized protein n=1 Tax=bioreactor metagenome TaxID=1076179 RepID=A0A645F3B1_9ZZZZ
MYQAFIKIGYEIEDFDTAIAELIDRMLKGSNTVHDRPTLPRLQQVLLRAGVTERGTVKFLPALRHPVEDNLIVWKRDLIAIHATQANPPE